MIIIYVVAGLVISTSSAFMTYIIIGVPIGKPMLLKIMLTIFIMLPIIGLISYLFGKFLSKRFNFINDRLEMIKSEDFSLDITKNRIYEITEINKNMNLLSTKLDNLICDLKNKNKNLSDLLVSMAHDIKTPITILNGQIEEIEDGLVSKDKLPLVLTHMKDEVKFLDELTVDMLEFITSMKNHKIQTNINLFKLIEQEIFTVLPKNENIKYINELDKKFTVYFNKIDLKKICLNVLFNAIKYTTSGYIRIYNKDDKILFENTGKVIENKYKDKIFEPFFTIDKSKNRKNSGFGLGLSIVRNFSKNNSYKFYLEFSNKDKTIFCLRKDLIK